MTTAPAIRDLAIREPALPVEFSPRAREALEASLSPNARRAYRAQWRLWEEWCGQRNIPPLGGDPGHLVEYLAERAAVSRLATVRASAQAISFGHRAAGLASPTNTELVRSCLRGLARTVGTPQRQVGALTDEALASVRATCTDLLTLTLVHTTSDAGLRRSEAAELVWGDVKLWEDGSGRLTVRRSKTDQEGEGAVVAVTPRTYRYLEDLRGDQGEGERVFPLSPSQIARRIKRACQAAGLGDEFSGHSGRIGMARRMAAKGSPDSIIMRQGRWRSPQMVSVYTRGESAGEALRYLS
ncbi:MAG: tyrosine-type recombinase/integrase [Dehalococcoidia bacterium]|nr:tyrosine-type recombinase/integrase [Dehalococcoidia bacterium]